MRVLVLEDNETSRFVIHAVLERAGFVCVEANTPAEAGRLLSEHSADLLIADAILGTENGVEAAERLQQARPGLPVLLVSGFPLQHLEARGLVKAANLNARTAFLQKPFTSEALLKSVQALLKPEAPL